MIPRYQRIAYFTLVGLIFLMATVLLRGCVRAHDRVIALRDESPIGAPTDSPPEQVQVALASDADGTITLDQITLPLPQEPALRARILLDRLLTNYAASTSQHPLAAGPAVADVFFVPLPLHTPQNFGQGDSLPSPSTTSYGLGPYGNLAGASQPTSPYGLNHPSGDILAVVNLTKAFADNHPSGIEPEDLTLRSILATVHANFSQVAEVRFLVDGQTRDTLNGHTDLTRPYQIADPVRSIHPLAADGNPE